MIDATMDCAKKRRLVVSLLLTFSSFSIAEGIVATVTPQGKTEIHVDHLDSDVQHNEGIDEVPCGLWLAESSLLDGEWGVFLGIDVDEEEVLSDVIEPLIPIYDANQNEGSPWHDLAWNGDIQADYLLHQNLYQNQAFIPGITSLIQCSKELSNVVPVPNFTVDYDSTGVHRSKDPTAFQRI